jgi:tellurite resistance protein
MRVMRARRPLPLDFFSIPFGLLGLADCWLAGAGFGLVPVAAGRIMVAFAAAAWLTVLLAYLRAARSNGVRLGCELADPIAGPFASLAVITPMLAAAGALYPLAHPAGRAVVDVGIAAVVLLAGWYTGQWILGPLEPARLHPGYLLPSVAGGFVASASAGLAGQIELARVLFGLGLVCWIVLGSIILGRLVLGPPLPGPLVPTIAIEVAPPAVATFAAFVIDGHRVDTTVQLLAGYGLLMVVAQIRLLPAYLRLRFMPSFWAFTFAWAAVAFSCMFWLGITHPAGWQAGCYLVLTLIFVLIGGIAVRTVIALARGQLWPAPAPPGSTRATTAPDLKVST